MTTLSWKPVRSGNIYCSPACGRGCTIQEHGAALKMGAKIVMRLGKEWRIEVHENLGWWVKVVSPCGRIKVAPSIGRDDKHPLRCIAFLGAANQPGGRWAEPGDSPEAAVEAVLQKAKAEWRGLFKLLDGLVELRL